MFQLQNTYLQNSNDRCAAGIIFHDALIHALVIFSSAIHDEALIGRDDDVAPRHRGQLLRILEPSDRRMGIPFSLATQHNRLSPKHFAENIRQRRRDDSGDAVNEQSRLATITARLLLLIEHPRDAGEGSGIRFLDVLDNQFPAVVLHFVLASRGDEIPIFRPADAEQRPRTGVGNAVEISVVANFDDGVGRRNDDLWRDVVSLVGSYLKGEKSNDVSGELKNL